MSFKPITRRSMLATGAAIAASSLIAPAQAQSLAPTETMRGGANNYRHRWQVNAFKSGPIQPKGTNGTRTATGRL